MNTPTPRAKIDDLPNVHKFRVMRGEDIIGQFSNLKLAAETARARRASVVLDMSAKPPKVVYRDGRLVEG
jgi:hypothetical protein